MGQFHNLSEVHFLLSEMGIVIGTLPHRVVKIKCVNVCGVLRTVSSTVVRGTLECQSLLQTLLGPKSYLLGLLHNCLQQFTHTHSFQSLPSLLVGLLWQQA